MEQEHARLRRMAEELQANIHREILEVNRRNSIEIAQSLYEMKAKAEAEVKNQQMLVPTYIHAYTYIPIYQAIQLESNQHPDGPTFNKVYVHTYMHTY